jgi:hypothetical protein
LTHVSHRHSPSKVKPNSKSQDQIQKYCLLNNIFFAIVLTFKQKVTESATFYLPNDVSKCALALLLEKLYLEENICLIETDVKYCLSHSKADPFDPASSDRH